MSDEPSGQGTSEQIGTSAPRTSLHAVFGVVKRTNPIKHRFIMIPLIGNCDHLIGKQQRDSLPRNVPQPGGEILRPRLAVSKLRSKLPDYVYTLCFHIHKT
jgi:hypothetical protein